MTKPLKVLVVTLEKTVFDGVADYISVPGKEGVLGILPRHLALFTQIEQGELGIKTKGESRHLVVAGGFVDIGPDHVTVLADSAVTSDELDEEKIRQAKKRAEEMLLEKLSRQDYVNAQAQLRKTLLDLKVATRRRKIPVNPL